MKPKIEQQRKVRKLRKQGLSYNAILRKVPVAKSSISLWCKDIQLSTKQQARLIEKRRLAGRKGSKIIGTQRRHQRIKEIQKIKNLAKTEIQRLTPYQFKIAGVMIYWAEGSKNNGVVVSNSDPKLISFMVDWFGKVCGLPPEKLKARLNIHANQNDAKIKKYWSRITGIPLNNFGKSYIKPEGTGHRKNILHNGVIRLGVYNEDLRHRIFAWIKALHLDITRKI